MAFSDEKYQRAYEALYSTALGMGAVFCRASFDWYETKEKKFTQAWFFENGSWLLKNNVIPDIIYDKTSEWGPIEAIRKQLAKEFPFINDPEFTRVVNSKYETSLLLPKYFKPYYKVLGASLLERELGKITSNFIVAKPERGSGGEGVIIDTPANLLSQKGKLGYPIILQEFINNSQGIPGVTPGYHDLRLVFINDELIYSYIRIPKAGSLLANVAQGGSMQIIELEALPDSLNPIIRDVQKAFAHFPRKIYTIDLLFDEYARPWIIEFNTMPGVYFVPGQESTRDYFYTRLVQSLLECKNSCQ